MDGGSSNLGLSGSLDITSGLRRIFFNCISSRPLLSKKMGSINCGDFLDLFLFSLKVLVKKKSMVRSSHLLCLSSQVESAAVASTASDFRFESFNLLKSLRTLLLRISRGKEKIL